MGGTAAGEVVLAVDGLVSDAARGRLSGVSLRVHAGEVVGVTGLLSAGVATLGRAIAGAEGYAAGQVRLHGRPVPPGRRDAAQRAGIGYVPEDRRAEGFVAHLGVAENATMSITRQLSDRFGVLRPGRRAAAAAPLTARLSLVSSGPGQPTGELSGGNQQKVTVARTLAHRPSLIVAITPTRGVDVASKELLLGSLADVAAGGAAGVLLCSDELSDLEICDRVIVLVRGEVFTEFTPAALRPRRADRRDRGPDRHDQQRGLWQHRLRQRPGGSRMISNQTPDGPVRTAVRVPASTGRPAGRGDGAARRRRRIGAWLRSVNVGVLREVALLPVLVLLIVVGTVVSPAFFTVSNFAGIGQQSSALGVVVVGESLILLIGGMDLSLESTFGLAPMVAAWLIVPVSAYGNGADLSPYLGIVVLLAVGAAVGLVNGLLIVKGRLNGFIVTLGMTIVLAGLQNGIVKAQSLFNLPGPFSYLGAASIGQVPVSLIVAVIIFILVGLFLRYHRTGRAIYAVGGNPAAARAAGIKVERVKIGVYVAGSILAAVGGLMESGRVSAVTGQQGYQEGIIFSVFAAAVIGGVSLKGGRGNMIGAASGVILLGIVQDILDLAQVSNYWIEAIDGAVILFALFLARIVGGESTAEEEVARWAELSGLAAVVTGGGRGSGWLPPGCWPSAARRSRCSTSSPVMSSPG